MQVNVNARLSREEKKVLICSICWFLWCTYFHRRWFESIMVTSLNGELGREEHNLFFPVWSSSGVPPIIPNYHNEQMLTIFNNIFHKINKTFWIMLKSFLFLPADWYPYLPSPETTTIKNLVCILPDYIFILLPLICVVKTIHSFALHILNFT